MSPSKYILYYSCIILNSELDELQARINIDGRNINNLSYANDTTLTSERKEELKSFLMKIKRRVKS